MREVVKMGRDLMPAKWEIHFKKGCLLLEKNILPWATQELCMATELNPTSALVHFYYAKSLFFEGFESGRHRKKALKEFEHAINLAPSNVRFRCEYAEALFESNLVDEAITVLDVAIALDNKQPEYYVIRSLIMAAEKKYSDALVAIEKACDLDSDPEKKLIKAEILISLGRVEEGSKIFKTVGGLPDTDGGKFPMHLGYNKPIRRAEIEDFWSDWED